jgi:hypothetical protein
MVPTPPDGRSYDRWEVGSEFEWASIPDGPREPLPEPYVLFALAQHGLIAIIQRLAGGGPSPELWLPEYYCPPVVKAWQDAGIPLRTYVDDPLEPAPQFDTLRPAGGAAVLAVNFFGTRAGAPWRSWQAANDHVVLVEDHSHDPAGPWARSSTADYAFASLRKTLPIPDGGVVWSPAGRPLPQAPARTDLTGSSFKLAAMILKREHLSGASLNVDDYRELQIRGEATLLASRDLAIAPWSRMLIEPGIPSKWRERRRRNVEAFFALTRSDRRFRSALNSPEDHACPFNGVIVFAEPAEREAVQRMLIVNHVYAAVHWAQPGATSARVRYLADRILTIPLDQRYDVADVRRIVEIIGSPNPSAGFESVGAVNPGDE